MEIKGLIPLLHGVASLASSVTAAAYLAAAFQHLLQQNVLLRASNCPGPSAVSLSQHFCPWFTRKGHQCKCTLTLRRIARAQAY
jgi:hypothetical protein